MDAPFPHIEPFRHDDHKFEMSEYEFRTWISHLLPQFKLQFEGVGDVVDGISCSSGVIISRC